MKGARAQARIDPHPRNPARERPHPAAIQILCRRRHAHDDPTVVRSDPASHHFARRKGTRAGLRGCVLFRLWAGRGTASPVQLAGQMITTLANAMPGRMIHVVGDAAYHGIALVVPGATITIRLPANAALFAPAPPRTGRRGRPRKKGGNLGRPRDVAGSARWATVRVERYDATDSVSLAVVGCLWHGAFSDTPGRLVLVRDPDATSGYGRAIFTTDLTAPPAQIVARYADRWSIEVANATGKQLLGVGQARNRVPRAVERTAPFGFLFQVLVIVWYTVYGHHPEDLDRRLRDEPWYTVKTEPAFEDMLAKLRRTIIAARFTQGCAHQAEPEQIRDYRLACAVAAA